MELGTLSVRDGERESCKYSVPEYIAGSTYEPADQPQLGHFPQPPPPYQPVATNANVGVVTTAPASATQTFIVTDSRPDNYLVLNILTLLFCCLIFGLIGLIYSLKVNSEWSHGNHQGAHDASCMARGWGIAGIVTGTAIILVCMVAFIVIPVLFALAAAASAS